MSTIFGRIIEGTLPCEKVYENERILAFKDIYPKAPVHLLIVPKKEIRCLQEIEPEDGPVLAEMLLVAKELAAKFSIADGYRLITNNGKKGGQVVEHLHFHLVGGKTFCSDTGFD